MNYISEDFHLHYLPTYSLYVQSDLHKDHLVVLDVEENVIVYISYDSEKPSVEASRMLSFPFEKVYVTLPHENLIWVPTEVFNAGELDLYKGYFLDRKDDRIEFQEFYSQGVTALYQIDCILSNRWINMFPNALILPSFSSVFNQAIRNIDFDNELLGVHMYGEHADIFLFLNGEMRIYNTYEVQNTDDLSFFLLSIMKNFALHSKIQRILLSGASKDSSWGQRLQFYTEHLEEMKATRKWKTPNEEIKQAIKGLNTLADCTVCE